MSTFNDMQLILLGSAIGLLGSIIGSLYSSQMRLRQQARLTLMDDLLPRMRRANAETLSTGGWRKRMSAECDELDRRALFLSHRERQRVRAIRRALASFLAHTPEFGEPDSHGQALETDESATRAMNHLDAYTNGIDALDAGIRRRLSL